MRLSYGKGITSAVSAAHFWKRFPHNHPPLQCKGGCSIINEPLRGVFYNLENMHRLISYIKDTRAELVHVSWPTRRQALIFTAIVIVISIAVSFSLGLVDYILSLILQKFVL